MVYLPEDGCLTGTDRVLISNSCMSCSILLNCMGYCAHSFLFDCLISLYYRQLLMTPPPFKILPLSEIHRFILQPSIDDWVLSYPSSFSNSQSWYLTIQPQLTLKPWYFHFSDLSRSIIIKLSRLRFGHNRLPPHLHRIGLSPSSHCPLHPSHI